MNIKELSKDERDLINMCRVRGEDLADLLKQAADRGITINVGMSEGKLNRFDVHKQMKVEFDGSTH